MSLTNTQLMDLSKRMRVPLHGVYFKSELIGMKVKHNVCYIINIQDELDENGRKNDGSHYTCFQSNKNVNGKVENIFLTATECRRVMKF